MSYFQVQITADHKHLDNISALLFNNGALGIEEKDNGLIAYFPSEKISEQALDRVLQTETTKQPFTYSIGYLAEENWNKNWERHYPAIEIDDFCYVRASFHEEKNHFKHSILIQPKMAFGTGHHATTYLMIRAMSNLDIENKRVLDLGSGTGILAILAEKMKAKSVTAIDIDKHAFNNLQENCLCNNCKKIESLQGTIDDIDKKYDLILANISRTVLIENAKNITDRLEIDGRLVVSGFLASDVEMIKDCYEKENLQFKGGANKNNWHCVQFKKVGKIFEV